MKEEQPKQQNNHNNFFKLTTQQLSENLEKYDCVGKGNPVTLGANALNSEVVFKSVVIPKRLNSLDSSMLEDAAYNVLDDVEYVLAGEVGGGACCDIAGHVEAPSPVFSAYYSHGQ